MEEKKVNKATGEVVIEKRLPRVSGQVFETPEKSKIIVWKEVKEIEKTGEGKSDFKIHCKLVPAEVYNRADHINSFSGDVGIQNILKKVALSGEDIGQVIESGRFYSKQKGDHVVDISKAPKDTFEALNEVEKGMKNYKTLPEELTKGRKFSTFAKEFNAEELNNYIEAQVQKRVAQKKEESQKGE